MPGWNAWVNRPSGLIKRGGSDGALGRDWFDLGREMFANLNICNRSVSLQDKTKVQSINRFLSVWNSLWCSKIHFMLYETKVLVANWLKLQQLFCGALYNQWKYKNMLFHCLNASLGWSHASQNFELNPLQYSEN